MGTYNKYAYNGPVVEFRTCIVDNWKGTTCAVSEEKAMINLTYQFKTQNNRLPSSNIKLTGKLKILEE